MHISKCHKWVNEAFKVKKSALLPSKISTKPTSDVFFTTMPCAIKECGVFGSKVVSRFSENMPALRLANGELLALIGADWIR